jgi:hypothetical protein
MGLTFFVLLMMSVANHALIPFSMKKSPITWPSTTKMAAPQTMFYCPTFEAAPDSLTRADSLDAGLVDPRSFSPDEFRSEFHRAEKMAKDRKQFLDEINGHSEAPRDWT